MRLVTEGREWNSSIEGNFVGPETKVYLRMKTWIVIVCGGLRWSGGWSLYWLGHLVSMPMRRWGSLYPIYNRLMLWSDGPRALGKGVQYSSRFLEPG